MFAIAHDVDSTVVLRRSGARGWEEVQRVSEKIDHDLEAERIAKALARKHREIYLGKLR